MLATLDLLPFHISFVVSYQSVSMKDFTKAMIDIALNLYMKLESGDILMIILNFSFFEDRVSIYLFL